MSNTARKNVRKVKEVDISSSFVSAVSEGDLVRVKKLVHSHGFSYCDCENGGYLLLFVAIKLGHIEIAKLLLRKGAKADCGMDNVSTPLHLATKQRLTEFVRLLLKKSVRVDARNEHNETPLHLAAKGGYLEIVDALLNHNASVIAQTNEGLTSLFLAAEGRHEKVVQLLIKHACANLEYSAKIRKLTPLYRALLFNPTMSDKVNRLVVSIVIKDDGQSKIVDELIDHGFILSQKHVKKSLLLSAVEKNHRKLMNSILQNGNICKNEKYNPLLLNSAVRKGHKEIAELLLKSGFDANADDEWGKTPLFYLSNIKDYDKYVEMLRLLLTNGADIKKASSLLHTAVSDESVEICRVLISNGVNINARNFGETPLYLAVFKIDYYDNIYRVLENKKQSDVTIRDKIAELLLESGADASIDISGYTAFHHAVLSGRKEAVSIFVKSGVNVDLRAKDGSTALFLASEKGYTEIVEILCKNNADVNACQRSTSPLYAALRKRKARVVKILLKFGAEINFWINDALYDGDSSDFSNGIDDSEKSTDGEYDEDYDDDFGDSVGILRGHSIKLKAAGFNVREQNIDQSVYSEFQEECEEELTWLKNKKLNAQFCLYDVLMNGQHPAYAQDKSLMWKLKSLNLDMFPLYKNLITSNLQKSQFRLKLLRSGQKWLDVLVKTSNKLNGNKYLVLPVEILEKIVSLLSNSELKSLISCGETLKHQLKQ